MTDQIDKTSAYFFQLVMSLQASAMQQMGKIMSQATGKIERNLEMAQYSIDMLEMLQAKSAGNLTEEEKKLLDHTLYELRLNYLDEAKKGETEAKAPQDQEAGSDEAEADTKEADDSESGTERPEKPAGSAE